LSKFLNRTATIDPNNDRFVNQIHRDDIAVGALSLVKPESTGRPHRFTTSLTTNQFCKASATAWLSQRLNRPLPPIRKSEQLRKRGDTNKRVSNAKLHQLGWTPIYPTFRDAMEKSILPSFAKIIAGPSR
jgi:hypothetical protein